MPRHATSTAVPHAPDKMFDLVADIERYPDFLPWCKALRVISRRREGDKEVILADMRVGYRMFRETFRSRVTLDRDQLFIDTKYVRGPLRDLQNQWRFEPETSGGVPLDRAGSIVHFDVSFSFLNPMLESAANAVFEDAFARMSEAFVKRADEIYAR